ncbi:MAG TPA: hypothetical protein VGA99_00235 [bacterium]
MKKAILLIYCIICLVVVSCAGGKRFSLAPIKTVDPDNANIPEPKAKEENQIWDIVDMTFFYQLEKVLDLNWTLRKVGKGLQVAKGRGADNVNALDETPNSSWYTNRHFHNHMSLEELARGPNITNGPDESAPWTITSGKFEGGTPGFTIKDAKGDRYIMKFDAPQFQEMGSSAEVISTKILHACGYNVPQNTIVYFDPKTLLIGETAKAEERGIKRQMTPADVEIMLKEIPRRSDGRIRALASKFVDGKPVGVWFYKGDRSDDPNDRVHHEHRRELRGLRTIGSWLSDEDRRAANTLAVYYTDKQNGNKYIKHFLIDMGSTLGSNNIIPHAPKYGNEYLVDPRTISLQFITLGLYVKPWEFDIRNLNPEFPSVGYYESKIFDPGEWYPTYPNPAFEYCTFRDAYWGAKIVTAFTDDDIRAIVETAKMSDPRAKEYLIQTMIERRDKVGRHWFERMNPLDKFRFEKTAAGDVTLAFTDLAVESKLERAEESQYVYTLSYNKKGRHRQSVVEAPALLISQNGHGFLDEILSGNGIKKEEDKIFSVKIQTGRKGKYLSKFVEVYFYYPNHNGTSRVVGIVREE